MLTLKELIHATFLLNENKLNNQYIDDIIKFLYARSYNSFQVINEYDTKININNNCDIIVPSELVYAFIRNVAPKEDIFNECVEIFLEDNNLEILNEDEISVNYKNFGAYLLENDYYDLSKEYLKFRNQILNEEILYIDYIDRINTFLDYININEVYINEEFVYNNIDENDILYNSNVDTFNNLNCLSESILNEGIGDYIIPGLLTTVAGTGLVMALGKSLTGKNEEDDGEGSSKPGIMYKIGTGIGGLFGALPEELSAPRDGYNKLANNNSQQNISSTNNTNTNNTVNSTNNNTNTNNNNNNTNVNNTNNRTNIINSTNNNTNSNNNQNSPTAQPVQTGTFNNRNIPQQQGGFFKKIFNTGRKAAANKIDRWLNLYFNLLNYDKDTVERAFREDEWPHISPDTSNKLKKLAALNVFFRQYFDKINSNENLRKKLQSEIDKITSDEDVKKALVSVINPKNDKNYTRMSLYEKIFMKRKKIADALIAKSNKGKLPEKEEKVLRRLLHANNGALMNFYKRTYKLKKNNNSNAAPIKSLPDQKTLNNTPQVNNNSKNEQHPIIKKNEKRSITSKARTLYYRGLKGRH